MAVEQLRDRRARDYRFIALRLPYGRQHDEEDAQRALRFIAPDQTYTVNIQFAVDSAVAAFEEATGLSMSDYNKGNQKAQQRMTVHYRVACQFNALVVGTDHAAEAVAGFFTKYGDGGVDLTPLTGLTKGQGRSLLQYLGADERLYTKPPTADLLDGNPGQLDEDELGISYAVLDAYLEGKEVSPEVARRIEARYEATEHKRRTPITPFDTWWKAGEGS
jgi:NAD+ synthase